MQILTQGAGYAASLDFAEKGKKVFIIEKERSQNWEGILPKVSEAMPGIPVLNFTNGYHRAEGDIGASALGFAVNAYSDVNLRLAQELHMKIPAIYKKDPPIPARRIGETTWLEQKHGTEYSVRGYWDGEKFSMFSMTGRWNRALAGDVGPLMSGSICTAFSILSGENPLAAAFANLDLYIHSKKDNFRGPVYITVIDDGTHLWYSDIYFGFRFPEEYALGRLAPAGKTYLGGLDRFGKGYALSLAVTLYDNTTFDIDEAQTDEARFDNVCADQHGRIIPSAFKIGYVIGKGKTFAEAAEEAFSIAEKISPDFGFRTDAGKRAKEWYYHVRKRIKC